MNDQLVLESAHLRAECSAQTGNLLSLQVAGEAGNLLDRIGCQYVFDGETFHEAPQDGASTFKVERVRQRDGGIETVLTTPHLHLTRTIELAPGGRMLLLHYRLRGLSAEAVALDRPALPAIDFNDTFVNIYEDDEDLAFEGAELGDGRELPCWRVFFTQDHDRGLIMATPTKRQMSHFQIRERSVEIKPHVMTAYDTNYDLQFQPIEVSRRRAYVAEFSIGPWQRREHDALLRDAGLEKPTDAKNPPPRGVRPRTRLKGEVFQAVDHVGDSGCSDTYHPNRWLNVSVPWTRSERVLYANPRTLPPAVDIAPRLSGVYRLYAGVGNGAGLVVRMSNLPEPLYCFNAHRDKNTQSLSERTPFYLRLSGRRQGDEMLCGTFELDSSTTLSLEALPNPYLASMLDYARLEPLSENEAKRWRRQQQTRPCTTLVGFADTPDIAVVTRTHDPDPEPFRATIWAHSRCGFDRVYWRIDGQCSDYPSKVNTMRYVSARVHGVFNPQAKGYGRALKKFDMLRVAVDSARKYGIGIYGWMRFNYYYGNVQSDFFKNHPEYWEEWEHRPGHTGGKLCLAFPEVRKHKIDILVEAAGYGLDGINLGFLRHPPVLHYHPVLVQGYRAEFGDDPPRDLDPQDSLHRASLPESGPEYERWYRYRARFLTQFGRELRAALRDNGLGHVKVSIWVRPNHALFDGIDIDAWLAEDLCDEVVADAQTGGDAAQPITDPTEAWKAQVQARVPLLRGIWWQNYDWSRHAISRFVEENYDGICTYESNMAVLDPRFVAMYNRLRKRRRSATSKRPAEASA